MKIKICTPYDHKVKFDLVDSDTNITIPNEKISFDGKKKEFNIEGNYTKRTFHFRLKGLSKLLYVSPNRTFKNPTYRSVYSIDLELSGLGKAIQWFYKENGKKSLVKITLTLIASIISISLTIPHVRIYLFSTHTETIYNSNDPSVEWDLVFTPEEYDIVCNTCRVTLSSNGKELNFFDTSYIAQLKLLNGARLSNISLYVPIGDEFRILDYKQHQQIESDRNLTYIDIEQNAVQGEYRLYAGLGKSNKPYSTQNLDDSDLPIITPPNGSKDDYWRYYNEVAPYLATSENYKSATTLAYTEMKNNRASVETCNEYSFCYFGLNYNLSNPDVANEPQLQIAYVELEFTNRDREYYAILTKTQGRNFVGNVLPNTHTIILSEKQINDRTILTDFFQNKLINDEGFYNIESRFCEEAIQEHFSISPNGLCNYHKADEMEKFSKDVQDLNITSIKKIKSNYDNN